MVPFLTPREPRSMATQSYELHPKALM
jgi:hypothetical protein